MSYKFYIFIGLLAAPGAFGDLLAHFQTISCPKENRLASSYVRHPTDCSVYYLCTQGKALPYQCASGLFWNDKLSKCVPEAVSDCLWKYAMGQKSRECSLPDGFRIEDQDDCHSYYVCYHGYLYQQLCPYGTRFNDASGRCEIGKCPPCHCATVSTPLPSTATPEPSTTTEEPSTTTEEPSTTTAEPSTTTEEPSTTTVEPSTTTVEPSTTTEEPSTTTAEPSTTTEEPSTTTVEPSTTTEEPSTTTVEPSTTTAEPSTTTEEPSTTTVEPSTTTEEPSTTTEEPSTTTEEPSTTTLEPSTTTLEPSTTTEEPSTTTSEPTTTTEEPSTTTAEPSTTTEEPSTTTEDPSTTTEDPLTTTQDQQTAPTSPPVDCNLHPNGAFVNHPSHCRQYYVCRNGEAVLHYCMKGLWFDGENYVCNFPKQVPCPANQD